MKFLLVALALRQLFRRAHELKQSHHQGYKSNFEASFKRQVSHCAQKLRILQ